MVFRTNGGFRAAVATLKLKKVSLLKQHLINTIYRPTFGLLYNEKYSGREQQ